VISFVSLAACGGTSTTTNNHNNTTTDSGTTSQPDSGSTGTTDSGTPVTGGSGFKTYVILGDSISDGGGEAPFFYDLLVKNDDTKYPAYKGKDLDTKYPGIAVVHAAKAGSTAKELVAQTQNLATTLAGPVLVTITIGGNDVQGAIGDYLLSGSDTKELTAFQTELDTSLAELSKPNRFGQGVAVKVLLANIYDPSDGTGNFKFADGTACPGALSYWPANNPTDATLAPWETAVSTTAQKYSPTSVLPLKDVFHGHGVPASPTWFFSDCIHPNAVGHDQVRQMFWGAIAAL
jgi:lysophospholipase L1-like esterase